MHGNIDEHEHIGWGQSQLNLLAKQDVRERLETRLCGVFPLLYGSFGSRCS
jgi:hypothetical protein